MARSRCVFVEELPTDAVKLDYQGVELHVSPKGDVFKMSWNKWLKIAQSRRKYGHAQINIRPKQTTAFVHRLVALAFIPNPDNLPLVCHKSEVLDTNGFLDNSVENLFWGTWQDNMDDMHQKGRNKQPKGSLHGRSKLTETDIPVIRQLYAAGKKQTEIAEIYGVCPHIISSIVNNKIWKHV